MAGVDPKSGEGSGGVEKDDEDPYQGGGKAAGVQIFLQSRCSVGIYLLFGDVGGYHRMGRVLGGFQDQVTLRLTSGSRGVGDA